MSEILLDLRGMRCPWPALRVARVLREAGADESVMAMADDPAAPGEIGAVARHHGWSTTFVENRLGSGLLLVRAGKR